MHDQKPRFAPLLIAIWAFLLFFIGFLGPAARQAMPPRSAGAPVANSPVAFVLPLVSLFAFAASIWVLVGIARLHRRPVLTALILLAGYPLLLVGKALVTGYFSAWVARFLAFLVVTNGLALWYLLRPSVRQFSSAVRPPPTAVPSA